MKRFILAILFVILANPSFASIDEGLDYNLINNAFSNPNPTTNKQFEDVMKQYETKKEGLFTKIFKFFDSDKAKYDEVLKTKYENPNNRPNRIKDVPEEKPTVLISANCTDSFGNEIKTGYYQVQFKKDENGKYFLELYQGTNKISATLYARLINEDEGSKEIVYGRAQALDNGYIKVIYANLDLTLLGYLKIIEEKKDNFELLL